MKLLFRGTNGRDVYTSSRVCAQAVNPQAGAAVGWLRESSLQVYVGCLAVAAGGLAGLAWARGYGLGSPAAVAVLAVTAAIAETQRVWITRETEASISSIPTLFAAVLFGPIAALVVGAISNLGSFGRPYLKWGVFTCSRAIVGALSGFVAAATSQLGASNLWKVALATAAGAITAESAETIFAVLTMRLRHKASLASIRIVAAVAFGLVLLYAPLVAALAVLYLQVSPLTLPLFVIPALAAQRLFRLYQQQRKLTEDLSVANVRLERANLSFATALVATLDARDRYTAGHSAAVAIYARDIAERLERSEEEQQLAHQCGLVHDIGKIGLPPGLLEKAGALTLGERRQMERHSEIGERILAKVENYAEIARIVRHHHERWDGQGYPDGIAEDEIPLISRIISVADAYNAMTSDRPYRDAMPSRVARMRLAQGVESQFDTTVVAAFEAILAGADEAYRTGRRADFSLADQDVYSEAAAAAVDLEPPAKPQVGEVAERSARERSAA